MKRTHQRHLPLFILSGLVLFALWCAPVAVFAADSWESYEINAQYRGGVKQGFQDLGCAIAWFNELPDGERQIMMHASVKHPQKKGEFYSFRLNLSYVIKNNILEPRKEAYSWFEGFEPEHQSQVRDMVLFFAMVHEGLVPPTADGRLMVGRTTLTCKPFALTTGKKQELDVMRPGNPVLEGKFFLNPGSAGKVWAVEKFRFKREKISVSFVTAPLDKTQAKYQNVAPFKDIVFGKGKQG